MRLKELLDNLNALVLNNPEFNELEVVYSIDEEGNAFLPVEFYPTIGVFDDGEFDSTSGPTPNSICIN